MQGIYIHVPFCLQKCSYCDFLSFKMDDLVQEQYVNALLREMQIYDCELFPRVIDTVYIGGGTPTALPSLLLCKILDAVRALNLAGDVEITVEANPGTLTREYLAEMKAHGVTRLSMGLQTTKPHLLKAINRLHSMEEFVENFNVARAVGFDNMNVDLMFALPGQTESDWRDTLGEIVKLAPEHISAYSLTPAENTPLWDALESGEIRLPDEDIDRKMYHMARQYLADEGYVHYELSNFAKPGFESHHNINCWQRVPYIGFGLGASSFDGEKRWRNTEDMQGYLKTFESQKQSLCPTVWDETASRTDIEYLTEGDIHSETMILGLRMMKGVLERNIPPVFAREVEDLIKNGLLAHENEFIRLTPRGMDLANQVFMAFV